MLNDVVDHGCAVHDSCVLGDLAVQYLSTFEPEQVISDMTRLEKISV